MTAIDRKIFFEDSRPLFGSYAQSQVDGINKILDEWERRGLTDLRWLSYMLATAFLETGKAMQPIRENLNYSAQGLINTFGKYFTPAQANAYAHQPERIANRAYANRMGNGPESSGDGWRFMGRGLPMITGKDNYAKFGIADDPEQALVDTVAIRIMFDGMINGMFTGKKLADYFGTTSDPLNARRIINGTDRAALIAGYYRVFFGALTEASA